MTKGVTRRFIDVSHGQIHTRIVSGGDERPLLLLHQASGSSKAMLPFARALSAAEGERRTILVPDLPGNGDSEPLPTPEPEATDFASAIQEALVAIGTGACDVYGFHAGASVALEVAIAHPDTVARLVLDSMGLYDASAARDMAVTYTPDLTRDRHGAHLLRAWHYVRDTYLFWPWFEQDARHVRAVGVPDVAVVHDKVVELLKGIDTYHLLYRAAFLHDKAARLPMLAVKTLATAGETNSQRGHLERIAELAGNCDTLVTPGVYTPAAMSAAAAAIAEWLARD